MAFRDFVLLVVKQNPEISSEALVLKFKDKYGSYESARAAVYRAIKDLTSLSCVHKTKDGKLRITAKGEELLTTQMKNKLILRLSEMISKHDVENADRILSQLHTLVERTKENPEFISIARSSSGFYITDLLFLEVLLDKKIMLMEKLKKSLDKYKNFLKEHNFPDYLLFPFSEKTIKKLDANIKKDQEIKKIVFTTSENFRKALAKKYNLDPRKELVIGKKLFKRFLLEVLETDFPLSPTDVLGVFDTGKFKIILKSFEIEVYGNYKDLFSLKTKDYDRKFIEKIKKEKISFP